MSVLNIESTLADICKDLRMLGDNDLTQQAICAYAAITNTEDPRPDLSYSYIMRKLRKGDKKRRLMFQKAFKEAFDTGLYQDVEDPAALALMVAVRAIDYRDED